MKYVEPHYDCAGVIHIHTTASDSEKELDEVVRTAKTLELDYIVLGDHNVVHPEYGRLQSRVLIVPGLEYTPGYAFEYDSEGRPTNFQSGASHLLAIGVTEPGTQDFSSPQGNIGAAAEMGGLSFLAHPADHWLPWEDWDVDGYHGLEIWTYLSDWAESTMAQRLGGRGLVDPDAILAGPPEAVLRHWDQVGRRRRLVGIGSMDAHSKMQNLGGEYHMVFPLEKELHGIRTHVLLPEALAEGAERARAQIVSAIGAGRCYAALDSRAEATGFQYWLELDGRRHEMGEEIEVGDASRSASLHVRLPREAQIQILQDGEIIAKSAADRLSTAVRSEPGVYRVEVRLGDRHWILSNPVYLRAAAPLGR